MVRATNSLPVPLSPVMSTEAVLGATSSISRKTSCIALEAPTSEPSSPLSRSSPLHRFQFAIGAALAGRILQDGAQPGWIDRLLDEVVGPQFHGGDRGVDAALRGQQDDGDLAWLKGDLLQQFHAVHARHAQVGHHNSGTPVGYFFQALHPVAGDFGAIAPGGDQFSQPGPFVFLILDDKNFFGTHNCTAFLRRCSGCLHREFRMKTNSPLCCQQICGGGAALEEELTCSAICEMRISQGM